MLLLYSCDLNPVQSQIPGQQWIFESVVTDSIATVAYARATSFGSSSSLYAGTQGDIAAGSLLRFSIPDSTTIGNISKAELYIFPKDTNLVMGTFYLDLILAADTTWAVDDTALALSQFSSVQRVAESTMDESSVRVYVASTILDSVEIAYVKFPVDTLILDDWRTGSVANNGFLITTDEPSLVDFYSTNSIKDPYLLIESTAFDTSDTTLHRDFLRPKQDTYVIDDNSTSTSAGLQLNFSQGKRVHIDFSDQFVPDFERPVAGGRLTLFKDEISQIAGNNVTFYVLFRDNKFSAWDDTSFTSIPQSVTMAATADSLVLSMTDFLLDIQNGVRENFGFDFLVNPINNDFDQLVFHDSSATTGLKPRLEILYATPYAVGDSQ